ncbi:hypothetical protein BDZ45DRAFT_623650 [Acephala macrosclerotiorum]|nr:hypothetical protein BDZ45DRAFT_812286 [Acephala macrosclerotiorum]KAF8857470.1 hypothetical protein BDZ45DRAFT_623650 [Acephala macrosclerotiorum]
MAKTTMNLASPVQLDIIDRLRALGISNFVALPQLAVVGDQSSGKSSVLESISELPFPRDSGLCTRFATQIIFRRASTSSVKVSIIPGPARSHQEAERLRSYVKDGLVTLGSHEFLEILKEVCQLMGIPGPSQPLDASQSTFSEDLLSIELCGPDKQNLSIIDIPGIFRTTTEGVTTQADMSLVRRIMDRHIRAERTIILAVIPSNIDITTQEILTLAKEVDPEGIRTLGVLTKPDLIDNGGEENVMSLVEGKRNPLRLGYCIVRNRGQSELSIDSAARHRKEKDFFSTEPWSRLDRDRVGTLALQARLQELLVSITRREFPKVQAQIVQQLLSCRKRLQSLGVDRESADQQRRFLLEMSREFQDITNSALDAYYSRNEVFRSTPELRLATLAVDRMERFSEEMERFGHTICFNSQDDSKTVRECSAPGTPSSDSEEHSTIANCKYPELVDFIPRDWETPKPSDSPIMKWIGEEYRKARGFGLGTIGPSVLPTIWQEQSKNWEGLTMAYIGDIVSFVHDFIYKALSHICRDERVRSSLWSLLQEQLLERYQKAVDHVRFTIQVERFGQPLTTNHDFNENFQKCRTRRLEKLLEKHAETQHSSNGWAQTGKVVKLERIRQLMNIDNAEYTIQEIHDRLESYYTVARKRFVDTVCTQGSDFHLLTGAISPLRIFGTAFVSELSAAQLDIIAGEDNSTKQLRKNLKNEIAALEEGRKLLRV